MKLLVAKLSSRSPATIPLYCMVAVLGVLGTWTLAAPATEAAQGSSLAVLDLRVEALELEVERLRKLIELNTHNHMLHEAKIRDGARALNEHLGVAFNNDRLLDMAAEDSKFCRRLYERAAEYRATWPFIHITDLP